MKNILEPYDLIISAVPGFMGYKTLKTIIDVKNVVDISFSPEDPLELHDLAKKNNVIALVDLGGCTGFRKILYLVTIIN